MPRSKPAAQPDRETPQDMAQEGRPEAPQATAERAGQPRKRQPLPQGYRQGIITAISILLGFSLAFLRFWAFEAPGDWTWTSSISTTALVVAVLMQIYTLLRSLRVADDDEPEYAKTVRWLVTSGVLTLLGLLLAAIEVSGTP